MDDILKDIIRRAIDMHVHVGPEIIPRRYDASSLLVEQRGKLAGAVLKNHFIPTVPLAEQATDFTEYGGLVLNWPAGGLNPEAIRAASYLAQNKFVVWLPTIHAANFLDKSEYEIAPEWCSGQSILARRAKEVEGIKLISPSGRLTASAKAVAKAVADANAVLATGHVSTEESIAMADYAIDQGVSAVIITHPIYQRISMPIAVQQRLASRGCYMEVCYSMYAIDGIPIEDLVDQIRAVGPERTILSSDVGQLTSPSPSDALLTFCKLLISTEIPVEWVKMMLVTNPKKILEGSI